MTAKDITNWFKNKHLSLFDTRDKLLNTRLFGLYSSARLNILSHICNISHLNTLTSYSFTQLNDTITGVTQNIKHPKIALSRLTSSF